jgi:23S rRNA pseudouridine1911/1915/1917 synthase
MPDPEEAIQFVADRGDARVRLDQVLVRRITSVTHMSRRAAQRWIEDGAVTVDGRVARRPSERVREHASIAVALPPDVVLRSTPEPEPGPLEILYEDEAILVINKPAGIVVHPSYKRLSGTLLNSVLWHLRGRQSAVPGILTRLDKDTSGVVVVAHGTGAHAAMQRDAAAGRAKKEYLAVVHGRPHPQSGVIRDPLGRDPGDRRRVIVTPGGAPSETRYEVTRVLDGDASVVRCELVTGRTHQIRVHLSARGWPLLGDTLYGGSSDRITRQALHACKVTLPHPLTREGISFEAPLPDDMAALAGSA